MIKKIIIYQTSDNKIFTTYKEAVEHENKENKISNIINNLDDTSTGIYGWYNKEEQQWYIGQSINLKGRYYCFTSWNSSYSNNKIDSARQRYPDIEYWDYTILEFCSREQLNDREDFYILKYDSINNGYNTRIGGQKTVINKPSQKIPSKYERIVSNAIWSNLKFCDGFSCEQDYLNWYLKHKRKGWQINYTLLNFNAEKQCISPNTIVMLPPDINQHLFGTRYKDITRLKYPRGMYCVRHNENGYYATCSKKGKQYSVGPVNTKREAEKLFFEEKINILRELAEEHKDEIEIRAYNALIALTPEDVESMSNGTMWTNVV